MFNIDVLVQQELQVFGKAMEHRKPVRVFLAKAKPAPATQMTLCGMIIRLPITRG